MRLAEAVKDILDPDDLLMFDAVDILQGSDDHGLEYWVGTHDNAPVEGLDVRERVELSPVVRAKQADGWHGQAPTRARGAGSPAGLQRRPASVSDNRRGRAGRYGVRR